jgi:hypothetical protein
MAHIRRQKRLVQHQRGILEARVHVAIGPLIGRMPMGMRPWFSAAKSSSVHFTSVSCSGPRPDAGLTQTLPSSRAFESCPGAGSPADRCERQRLHVDLDLLDRLGARQLVHGRHRQNRLALVHRLVGQRQLAPLVALIMVPLSFMYAAWPGTSPASESPSRPASPALSPRGCSSRARAASGSAPAGKTASPPRENPRHTSTCPSPSPPGRWSSKSLPISLYPVPNGRGCSLSAFIALSCGVSAMAQALLCCSSCAACPFRMYSAPRIIESRILL